MKMRKFILLIISLLPVVFACQKEAVITVSDTDIEAPHTGGEYSLTISPSVSWTAEVYYVSGDDRNWIEIPSTSGGKGQQEFVFKLKENPRRLREAKLYFTLANDPSTLTIIYISQEGMLDRDMTDAMDIWLAAYLMTQHPHWGRITYEDIISCKSITFDSISPSMTFGGLSMFTGLDRIGIRYSDLHRLNFGEVPWLKEMTIEESSIQELDLSGNTELDNLFCRDVYVGTLDAGNNPKLKTIEFDTYHTDIKSGVDKAIIGPGIETFFTQCKLKEIDCSRATDLSWLYFPNGDVHRLDVSNTAIKSLEINNNPIDELVLPSKLERLDYYRCKGTLSSLALVAGITTAVISLTPLKELNVDACKSLNNLNCTYNLLQRLDVSRIPLPGKLAFEGNPGINGVFELIVSPEDYEKARELFEGRDWNTEDGEYVVTRVKKSI